LVTLTDERRYDLATVQHRPNGDHVAVLRTDPCGRREFAEARRVGEAWAAKRAKATTTPLTAKVPGWLQLDRAKGKIKLIPERAKIVRQIFEMTLKGVGQDSIAKQLNARHVPHLRTRQTLAAVVHREDHDQPCGHRRVRPAFEAEGRRREAKAARSDPRLLSGSHREGRLQSSAGDASHADAAAWSARY